MPDCCAAANCDQKPDQSGVLFFSFPLDPERCKQWLSNCDRPDLQTKTAEQLHNDYKLCAKHFDGSLICQDGAVKTVLKDGAVPTIFDFTNMQAPQSRKRTGESNNEESGEVKRTKDDQTPEPGEMSLAIDPPEDDPEKQNSSHSKAKEILKVYFKETLAFIGFSIGNSAALSAASPMGAANPVCAEKIDKKEVLKFSEDVMREEIRNSIRAARFFSILLQDVTNIDGKEQIPIFVRSVTGAGFPQKHLIGFLPCDADSESLFFMLLSEIRNRWGLRMEHCRGLTYLTTGAICQKMKELSSRMLRDFPQVVLAPSDPYAFNMWLIRSMPMLSIQNVINTLEEIAGLLRRVPALWEKLEWQISVSYSNIKGEVERVKEACQLHWEYGLDAFQTMLDILEPLLACIAELNMSSQTLLDPDTLEQLNKLKLTLKDFNFIIILVVLKNTLCCVSILNPSLRGTISISSTLQYTISNALKLLHKYLQEVAIFHRKWFSDALSRAVKLGVGVTLPEDASEMGHATPEDYYRETLSRSILLYLVDEVKRVFSTEMVRILRWLSLVPSYMADHNFSIRRDKVADANLNNLSRPDSFYDELGCWEVKWKHASKRRILPTTVFATLKIPDIGFYPNVQSLLRVLGTIPCVNAEADVYGQYDMVLDRYHNYLKETTAEQRRCNMAFVYVNQDVHFSVEDMVESYVEKHPDILQLLPMEEDVKDIQAMAVENDENHHAKEEEDEKQPVLLEMDVDKKSQAECAETNREALKSALQAAVTSACNSHNSQVREETEVEYVSKSEMQEVLRVCEDAVREGILAEIGNSFFSLFIDRVVQLGEEDYLPLFLRFVDSFDVMRLELMGFVETTLDCESLCERLFEIITKEWQLDLSYCRGQAYLGSGDVTYKLKAFACKIQEKYPLAICTHSSCYSFNVWWSKSIPVPSITRALDTFEQVILFFSSSPALERQLDQVIGIGLRESFEKIHELQGTYCSSWLEKHDSYDVFVQMLEPLVECLEKIQSNKPQRWSTTVSTRASAVLQLICDFDFIVSMVALKNVSSFTKELSAGLQKDHFSAASQLCQISGIVATLNRVKTNIKLFHQNWFDEACAFAQSLKVPIKLPDDAAAAARDGMVKPAAYYKDTLSNPLVDNLINAVKDYFSDDHKEALNFLSLVPCSVTVSYMFETLKSKPPLYSSDLPDPDNFFTELCCWRVKWKTKVASINIPNTIFQTLRLPLMQYFGNISTLLRIMCVLPSTALEFCGETKCHQTFQEYLRNTPAKDRSSCLAMLQVGTNFKRDLDRMVAKCLTVTPKALEGLCLDKEAKSIMKNSETSMEVDFKEDGEDLDARPCLEVKEEDVMRPVDENGHSGDNRLSAERVFRQAVWLARKNCPLSELSKDDQDHLTEELSLCHWAQGDGKSSFSITDEALIDIIAMSIRDSILTEIQESPFFSVIIDKAVILAGKRYLPVFARYVRDCAPKVELLGFLPSSESCDTDSQARAFSKTLTEDWGLQMGSCRGQAYMRVGAESESLRRMSLDFLETYPLAVNTPSETCGLAQWMAGCLKCEGVSALLGIVEDLVHFFEQSPKLESELAEVVDGLLNTPREALEEIPETFCSRWKKREDFFDILADTLEGLLGCLRSVCRNASGMWNASTVLHAQLLSAAISGADFVVALVILKNACAPLKNCSTVFRCGNPADIIDELEKITPIIESLSNMLENVNALHSPWFEQATQLISKVSDTVVYPDAVALHESPEVYYRDGITVPVLKGLIEEMRYYFSEGHLNALKVLSLLPTCNPQPVLADSPDQLHSIFLGDLPEPDTAEQDLNTWATAWREKYQDVSPPASISETLLHAESRSNPNVTTLLKLVAVLPSVSMECDLMKSSLRALLGMTVSRGSRTATVMLLIHRQMLHRLDEVIEKCIASDPESLIFLTQVKERVDSLKLENDICPRQINGSCKQGEDDEDDYAGLKSECPDGSTSLGSSSTFYSATEREEMMKELQDSQFFTIITEKAVKIGSELYIPVCIKYLDKQDTQCEETIAFIPLGSESKVFADAMETAVSEKWGLNMGRCRGQALLSVGAAGIQMRAVAALICQKYPCALRSLSSAVSLNMWLARSCPVAAVASGCALVEKMLLFFSSDMQRQTLLEDTIVFVFRQDEGKANDLRDQLSSSHWERSHDMLGLMVDILESLTLCLSEMRRNQKCCSESTNFFSTLQNFEFIFSVVAMKNILSVTKNLSEGLQGKPIDVLHAVNSLPTVLNALNEMKRDLDSCHRAWFNEAVALSSRLQVRLLHSALQASLSEYYRDVVSGVLLDHATSEIMELFSDRVLDSMRCLEVVPYVLSKTEISCTDVGLVSLYKDDIPDIDSLPSEMENWRKKWADSMTAMYHPATVLDTLKASDIRSFCNIEMLLRLLVVLPFSRKESSFRPGKRSLEEFLQQPKSSELHHL
ncbi:uncharacterized protein LOC114793048 [Denticeps clupeoides]|uniref:THAP-type domain-containing protein n=1 Tax=Denticeps clupeoides TaxID=299321 RepID=A0AAY4AMA0_9TELE|nr:uncharacterized protein LOC114793048 [Denticeps clupeoides]